MFRFHIGVIAAIFCSPAYAAPECEADWKGYKPMKVELVAHAKEKLIANATRICTVARMAFSIDGEAAQLDLPVGSDAFLFGFIDLSDQDVESQFTTKEKCGAAVTGEECVVAAYGTIVTHPKRNSRWMLIPTRVDYSW